MRRSIIISISIAVIAIVWVFSGQLKEEDIINKKEKLIESGTKINKNFLVEAKKFTSSEKTSEIILRGRTEALRRIDVKAETAGKVIKIYNNLRCIITCK